MSEKTALRDSPWFRKIVSFMIAAIALLMVEATFGFKVMVLVGLALMASDLNEVKEYTTSG